MKCPNCFTDNYKDAVKCECGYQFIGYKPSADADNSININTNKNIGDKNIGISNVIIEDINMSFGSMVLFMVKWAIASIPAFIILLFIGIGFLGMLGIGGAIFGWLASHTL